MSTTAYYNFINNNKRRDTVAGDVVAHPHGSSHICDARRQSANSPSSYINTSTSTSSSSLNQYNSHPSNYALHSLEPKPFKPFKSSSEYLEAMKEDLAEWFNRLYSDLDLTTENFFSSLDNGAIICRHANHLTQMGRNSIHFNHDSSISSSDSGFNDSTNTNLFQTTNDTRVVFNSTITTKTSTNNNNNNTISPASPTSSDSSLLLCKNIQEQQHSSLQTTSSSTFSSSSSSSSSYPRLSPGSFINWLNVKLLTFKQDAKPGTFFARDNICQFILWCRSLNIHECLLFETDDLVARKNEKSFILCLLEVARIGFKVGMPTPLIIQLEQEIDREIENETNETENQNENENHNEIEDDNGTNDNQDEKEEEIEEGPKQQVINNDLESLHEKVVQLLCQCTCPTQFPMVRVGDNGKYKVGDKLIIFVRILRRHIMVRVGGGWQELSEFLRVKDPCRSRQSFSSGSFGNNGNIINANCAGNQSNQHNQQQNNLLSNTSTNQRGSHQQIQAKIHPSSYISYIPTAASKSVSKSRLVESSHHLNNKGHHHRNGHKLISSSASMSWLSHNS